MITCDFKAGIGTSSRKLPESHGGYTLGVLVNSNFGKMHNLRVGGLPLGEVLEERFEKHHRRQDSYGSIIAVVATDAPLLPNQISRLCKRVGLGIGRVGSYAAHGSGEIVVGFSTANVIPRRTKKMVTKVKLLLDQRLDPLYEAVMEATEEAILNAMCMAGPMTGVNGHTSSGAAFGRGPPLRGPLPASVAEAGAAAPPRPTPSDAERAATSAWPKPDRPPSEAPRGFRFPPSPPLRTDDVQASAEGGLAFWDRPLLEQAPACAEEDARPCSEEKSQRNAGARSTAKWHAAGASTSASG